MARPRRNLSRRDARLASPFSSPFTSPVASPIANVGSRGNNQNRQAAPQASRNIASTTLNRIINGPFRRLGDMTPAEMRNLFSPNLRCLAVETSTALNALETTRDAVDDAADDTADETADKAAKKTADKAAKKTTDKAAKKTVRAKGEATLTTASRPKRKHPEAVVIDLVSGDEDDQHRPAKCRKTGDKIANAGIHQFRVGIITAIMNPAYQAVFTDESLLDTNNLLSDLHASVARKISEAEAGPNLDE